ncbi:TaqI-like C-terminal specificity domain-containing protein [Salinivibrio sp. VYel1]|uniref:Eco57I restriction-modification methylase domain-containing protein n=1 Tax=Salinivibrio sp. VYel1 TaxID=2490490 RepID=UPI00128D6342|nr:TaqI-like C-terminal specificity domain-containing protein [Salinivibrio sp. VYel1]MPX91407.1 hypothetical protein [Salinivibrio sp. VYel1]
MQEAFQFENQRLEAELAAWEVSDSDKGQIYTRPEVVEFMLTAIGLNTAEDVEQCRILEPSCGEGEFVIAIVRRLLSVYEQRPSVDKLSPMLLAVDMVGISLDIAKRKVSSLLFGHGYNSTEVEFLLSQWFLKADFLQADIPQGFTHVIGNPPYVRVESIPKGILRSYRQRFVTMTDRADLYIPFYEKGLSVLEKKGRLSFICTDRWVKNTYGKSLRKFISDSFGLELFVDLYGVEAFEKTVMTYPAITQIVKKRRDLTVLMHETDFSEKEAKKAVAALQGEGTDLQVRRDVVNGERPWLLGSSDQVALVNKLESKFPLLEDAGCKVFIGAATGANKVYIVNSDHVGAVIEESRLLPLITANEIKNGDIRWKERYLINTYDDNGLVDLDDYPLLSEYLNNHKKALCERHVAKKDPTRWYKTIDRVYEHRARTEKLLIPDISSEPVVIYDEGRYYPNNSIYYVCSDEWDLSALRVILLSNITKVFISTYSTKIAKGYLRFQAQHLRKLRLPRWNSLSEDLRNRLIAAGQMEPVEMDFLSLACEVYELNEKEKSIVGI